MDAPSVTTVEHEKAGKLLIDCISKRLFTDPVSSGNSLSGHLQSVINEVSESLNADQELMAIIRKGIFASGVSSIKKICAPPPPIPPLGNRVMGQSPTIKA
jgi:uncharacterized membrane-anchored protein YjiN (DUF445 family)